MPAAMNPEVGRELTVAEAAWLAAMLDAEGSICLLQTWRPVGLRRKPFFKVRVEVGNYDRRLIEALVDRTGFGAVQGPYTPGNPRARPYYRWAVSANACRVLLPPTLPWLVCKRRQAELAIEALVIKDARLLTFSTDDAQRERMVAIHAEMRRLNDRGR